MKTPAQQGAVPLRLFDPEKGGLAFRLDPLEDGILSEPQRFNYFTVVWVREGHGEFHPDLAGYRFQAPTLLFGNPYQTVFVSPLSPLRGTVLQFHANFFCIEAHHEEVGCNGVLFNDLYGHPMVVIGEAAVAEITGLMDQMEEEYRNAGVAQSELLVSLLKILLIKAARLKLDQLTSPAVAGGTGKSPRLARLVELIERHYRILHRPHEYAALLAMTPKALGKLTKQHFGRTLTELIRERLLKHAKWQLLHTVRPVKEIAAEVGFGDELYFSRLFKSATGFSPSSFREFETAIRKGSNLSM